MIQLHQSIEKEVVRKSKNRQSVESKPEEIKEEKKEEEGFGEKI